MVVTARDRKMAGSFQLEGAIARSLDISSG
jgi:hypothetical protein